MSICRADKILLTGGAALLGGAALTGASMLGLGIPAAALFAVLVDGVVRPGSSTFYRTISHGPRDRPRVALTFDDGPDPQVTPAVLDTLARFDARATFFMIGRHLEQHAAIGRRAVAEGHELGSHSWQHSPWLNFRSTRRQQLELERAANAIQGITGRMHEPLHRPPVGLKSPEFARAAHARGLTVVAWSVHSRDTRLDHPGRIAGRVLERIQPGDIVLMHDGHHQPNRRRHAGSQALPLILAGLRERGLEPVTVATLLATSG